ncbi:MAG TPA: PrsW family glutamic-type intramembrane protease [Dictyoglomaceae bacterium]|nr:PrsW family glutamic-type intramembrane protease [Dictyoglomaceae bacterium]HOL39361.1 PrsW family glutamic-type intramembrane protease [Dictyoglomaceae bacterium]HOP94824.1 PrsW family glutamic-type intramembrane protease [Dictyoglomaceae bacterium]HPP15957.1 PrsW family glutamic-type intramembrane protease [Dictyoglomaceae bacterium]HPU43281.1 PrsW family glutamic-type intramembrane protease [Dictyoglomaceae bacterium]
MDILIIAIAPGIALGWYVYSKDRWNKEPSLLIFYAFLLGMIISFPAAFLEFVIESLNLIPLGKDLISTFIYALIGIALVEEGAKYLVIYKYLYPKEEFDEPFDGIVYSVMVGLGFATLENILYVSADGFITGVLRAFLAVPAHFIFALFMGYAFGLAKFSYHPEKYLIQALTYPIFWHGLYDFLILSHKAYLSILILPIVYGVGRWIWKKGQKLIILK